MPSSPAVVFGRNMVKSKVMRPPLGWVEERERELGSVCVSVSMVLEGMSMMLVSLVRAI